MARAEDENAIAAIITVATDDLRQVYRPRGQRSTPAGTHRWERLVALDDTRVAGVVDFLRGTAEWEIRGLAVLPARRRCGVARALVEHIATLARSSGAVRIALNTIEETGNPTHFERLGFVILDRELADGFEGVHGQPVTRVKMVRPVA